MNRDTFGYVTYVATTPDKLWEALTSGDLTKQYWFGRNVQSDWKVGSAITFSDENGTPTDKGIILKSDPHRLLSYTFQYLEDPTVRERPSRVTFELKPMDGTVRLTLRHEDLLPTDFFDAETGFRGINNGWPAILSNLKSLLETGRTLPALML